jgi:hypothetical protein
MDARMLGSIERGSLMGMEFSQIQIKMKSTMGSGKTIKRMEKVCSRGIMVLVMMEVT